jgi:hypothetical protein
VDEAAGSFTATYQYGGSVFAPTRNLNIVVTVRDNDGGSNAGSVPISVGDIPAVLSLEQGLTAPAGREWVVTPLGTFTHFDFGTPAVYHVSIDWGDGTPPDSLFADTVVDAQSGQTLGSFPGIHRYRFVGNYTITVTLTDPGGVEVTASTAVRVIPPPIRQSFALVDGHIVHVYNSITQAPEFDVQPFEPGYLGTINVAVGDVNGDGVADLVAAAGAGGGPRVRVFDGATRQVLADFFAYGADLRGGVWVAAGDLDGDGTAELITGAGAGGGPHVKVWDVVPLTERFGLFAYEPGFLGGVHVAAADLDGDGRAEIITSPGIGGGPHIRVFNGLDGAARASFLAYDVSVRGGIRTAAGDFEGDGVADLVVAPESGGGPRVRVFDGPSVLSGSFPTVLNDFFAGNPANFDGIVIEAADLDGDVLADLLVSPRRDGSRGVDVYDGKGLAAGEQEPDPLALPGILSGFSVD